MSSAVSLVLFVIIALHGEALAQKQKDDGPSVHAAIKYRPINCQTTSITNNHTTWRDEWAYHIDVLKPINSSSYSFCLMEDPTQGNDVGVVSYTMSVRLCGYDVKAGMGVYFNFRDPGNYEMIYKLDKMSNKCVHGYLEDNIVYNSTVFMCQMIVNSNSYWTDFHIEVTPEESYFTMDSIKYTFKPISSMVPKSGPLIANAFMNSLFHPQEIYTNYETCQTKPEMCDKCTLQYNTLSTPVTPLPNPSNYMLWYSRILENVYTACYIKVLVKKGSEEIVKASSYVGNLTHANISPGDSYGVRQACTNQHIACVEVKSAGTITDGVNSFEDTTKIEVILDNYDGINTLDVNPLLERVYGNDIIERGSTKFSMFLLERVYGKDFGIYCHSTKSGAYKARDVAYTKCMTGDRRAEGQSEAGWAIKFH